MSGTDLNCLNLDMVFLTLLIIISMVFGYLSIIKYRYLTLSVLCVTITEAVALATEAVTIM